MAWFREVWSKRSVRLGVFGVAALLVVAVAIPVVWPRLRGAESHAERGDVRVTQPLGKTHGKPAGKREPGVILLTAEQQAAIGLTLTRVESSSITEAIDAPGKVVPDEARFAYITPRASGVVRTVSAQIGQEVHAGELLATLDSPEVAQARLELLTREQLLDVARTKSDWQEGITAATLELIDQLRANTPPEEVRKRFEGRAVGADRERLLTADAQRRLTWTSLERNRDLLKNDAVALSRFQMVQAEYESALATYQGLMDRVGVETKLANTLAQQDLRAAQTSTRVARERLRVLDVLPEPNEPDVAPKSQPASGPTATTPTDPTQPLTTYTIRAPFDGVILDREMIVPGVAVDTLHRIYTMADLSSVWVEASVHESHFGMLSGSEGGQVELTSPAYPGRAFTGTVLYTGDLVDEKSRMVKLLAQANNADRTLKPGMYVDVAIHGKLGRDALMIPDSALLTEADKTFVFVRETPERFRRHDILIGEREGGLVAVFKGIESGSEVVSEGAFKLKAEAIRTASE